MTCYIASADPVFADELRALAMLVGAVIVNDGADMLLLDLDAPIVAPPCRKTLRFSALPASGADFVRPFSYRTLLSALQAEDSEDTVGGMGCVFLASETFTATEKRLLDALMQTGDETVTSADLAKEVFGSAECQNELKVYIRHLRRKIEEPSGIRVIETVRGVGYRFRHDRTVKPYTAPKQE